MRPALVLDFDGTLTTCDVGDALCERFADPGWKAIDQRFERGELSLPEAQRQMWGLFRAREAQARAYALEVGLLRPGLDALLEVADARGYRLVLASGGFDFYIRAILGPERLGRFAAVHCNRLRFSGERVSLGFARGLSCARCAVCKGQVLGRCGPGSVFVGDGHSDTCALGRAAQIFAVRGQRLHRAATERGAEVTAFDTLDEVASALL